MKRIDLIKPKLNPTFIGSWILNSYICEDIIKYYEKNKQKQVQGVTSGGVQLNVKDSKAILEGLQITINKLYKELEKQNIIKFDSEGEIFDPNLHDAMMVKKSKKKKNIIIEEFEKGYKYNEKVIRHSKVVVSQGK